ncbi:hypothetical protein [Dyadobacter fermentans]|uniref:hypothetical protein n=1 Tax=Dyadobacter fermentans TaxID=94254 RepID=UPI001CBB2687|nr:hypothetical protein [Dyadobacter fermentans]MBZ1362719.1 hypothetical protein [Dyadobacter fermentans]
MLRDFLASFRDYCYNETKNSRDEQYAEGAHGPMFVMGLILYFLPIPIWIYVFIYRFIGSLPHVMIRNNLVLRLVAGGLMFYLGYKISAYFFSVAQQVPVNRNWDKQKLSDLRWIYVLVMAFSVVFFFLALWLPGFLRQQLE